jgi:glycosyltransferase involved in cell wall biosynthesis
MRENRPTRSSAGRRVLMLLATHLYPADIRVEREATSLVAAGYRVTVICPRYTRRQWQPWHEVIGGVQVYRYPTLLRRFDVFGYLWGYAYAWAAMSLLTLWVFVREGFDVIHAHNPPDNLVFVAAPYKLLGRRFVFDHHDIAPEMYQSIFTPGKPLLYRALVWLEQWSCRWADRVIATNQSYRRIEMQRGRVPPERIAIVRNGPDLSILRPVEPDPALRPAGKITLGYVGAIGLHDGVDYLLRALRHLIDDLGRTDFLCVVVGGGKLQPRLKALSEAMGLAEFVRFIGPVEHAEVARYLSSFDICLAPEPSNAYNDRSTVIKIAEYMALGKPTVAFDLPEHRVTAQDSAVYVRPNDELDFAQAIASLMDRPDLRQSLGCRGKARVAAELAWCHQVECLLSTYASLWT